MMGGWRPIAAHLHRSRTLPDPGQRKGPGNQMLMFLLKKIAASLLSPLSLCIELLLLGLFLLWFTCKQRAGKIIVSHPFRVKRILGNMVT